MTTASADPGGADGPTSEPLPAEGIDEMTSGVRDGRLVGRSHELQMLREIADALRSGRGGAIVVTGAAGVGKTALVRAVTTEPQGSLGEADGIAVSAVTAAKSERDWPYAGLHLVLSGMIGALSSSARAGMESQLSATLDRLDAKSPPHDVAVELLSVIGAAQVPVLVVVDDAQHLDVHSQEVVGFVARRLASLPLALLLVGQLGGGSMPFLDGVATLRVRELEHEEAVDLLRDAHPDMVRAVTDELVRRVGADLRTLLGVADRLPLEQRRGQTALDRYLPTATELRDRILADLDGLSGSQRFALLVASVSEDHRVVPMLTALTHSDSDSGEQGDTAEWLFSRYLEVSSDSYRWRNPAISWVVWHASQLNERVRAHLRLAEAYQGLDTSQVLWHRACAQLEYDDELAASLERASSRLLERGEVGRSYALAKESVRLTSDPAERIRRSLLSGELALFVGRADEAVRIVRENSRMELSAEQCTEFALLEARARVIGDGHVPTELIDDESRSLARSDPERAARFWLVGAAGFADRIEVAEAMDFLSRVERLLPRLSDRTQRSYLRIAAWVASLRGEFDRARALIEADSGEPDIFSEADRVVRHAMVLIRLERFDEARRLLRVITEQRRFGASPALVGHAYSVTGVLEIRAGRLRAARAAAESWQRLIGPQAFYRGRIPVYMIRAHALMGDLDAARQCHNLAQSLAQELGDWWTSALAQSETGAMHLLADELDEAVPALERARHHALSYDDPSLLAVEPDFIEACLRRGDVERARTALTTYESRAAGVPTSWALHTVARCRALVAEGEDSVEAFAVAVRTCVESVSPVELARTQLCYGERLRALGRHAEAVQRLHHAIVLASEVGASGLVTRAQEELGFVARGLLAMPRQRRELDSLTERERRVVDLVVAGRRNREIAAELFVSVRTVETHLGKIYRKLGVRSRAELAGIVVPADVPPDATADVDEP